MNKEQNVRFVTRNALPAWYFLITLFTYFRFSQLMNYDSLTLAYCSSFKTYIQTKVVLNTEAITVWKNIYSREATHRFRTSNNAKSNPEIKGCNSIFFRHDALQVSGHALFTSTSHVFLLNIFINKTERSIHFY